MFTKSTLVVALATLGASSAHIGRGCGGHEVAKRNVGGALREYVPRQTASAATSAPTDVASAAQSTDPNFECQPYSYQKVLDIRSNYPTIWQTANLLPDDAEAQQIFQQINATVNSKVPNINPKGTSSGDFSAVGYNATDPDCWWTWRQCTQPSDTSIPADISSLPEPQTWGLGFDDGPNCSHNALYDMLAENNQKATMFYIGSNVIDWPLQAMRGIEDGHEICIHTWSHQYMTSFSNEVAFAELYYTRKIIKELLGVTPLCWRPPFGDIDNRIRLIAQGLNLTSILWDQDSEDWRANTGNITEADVDQNYDAFVAQGKNGTWSSGGTVVLNHELNNFTMQEMVKYFPQLKEAYKYIVPIAVGLNLTQPYAEANYSFPTFEQYIGGQVNVTTSDGSNATSYPKSGDSSPSGTAAAQSGSAAESAAGSKASASSKPTGAALLNAEASTGLLAVMYVLGLSALL